MNLSLILEMARDGFGDRRIVGRRAEALTAAQLDRLADTGATLIRGAGASALVYLDVNGPAFPVALFAAARAGVPLVPLNYRLGAGQLRDLLARHADALVISDESWFPMLTAVGLRAYSSIEWMRECAGAVNDVLQIPDDPNQPAVVIYTSGTTSEPKGVLLRHENLISYVLRAVEFASAQEHDAALVSVPPYHIAAVANAITSLYTGRRTVTIEQFSGAEWLDVARTEGVTNALVVPTMLARIMLVDGDRSVPTLRALAYGGAPMPLWVIEAALHQWPEVEFVNAYGLTETSSTISMLGPEEHRRAVAGDPAARRRLGSVGTPLPGVEVLVRGEDGCILPPGSVGRIWVRGEQVSGEYSTGSVLDAAGYFDTRDNGYFDRAGYLFIAGRSDDTIIRGGENIAPADIEETFLLHPDVSDAVVVGLPDAEWGQRLAAVVVCSPGSELNVEELRNFVRSRLRGSKTPERIDLWLEIPRTETGKVVRRRIVELLLEESRC